MNSAAMLSGDPYWAGIDILACGIGEDYRQLARTRGGRVCPHESDRPLTLTMMMEQGKTPVASQPRAARIIPDALTPSAIEEKRRHAQETKRAYRLAHRAERCEWQRQYRQRKSHRALTLTNPNATLEVARE